MRSSLCNRAYLRVGSLLFTFWLLTLPVYARLRVPYEDAEVVERSKLIVIAHIREHSIKYVPRRSGSSDQGRAYHEAILEISAVLKGSTEGNELSFVLNPGLTPVVGGYVKEDGLTLKIRNLDGSYPPDKIDIFDTDNSAVGGSLIEDAREDNLWFLRCTRGSGRCSITDPEDIQPIRLSDYFRAYMNADPESAIREQLTQNNEISKRATRYLDHLEVQRVFQLPDTKERIEKLLPYFVKNTSWGLKSEVRDGIVACGETAGPFLLKLLNEPVPDDIKEEIIRMFGEIKYRGCISALVEILEVQDRFWSKQSLNEGWWNRNVESEETKARRHSYGLVLDAVSTLGTLGDSRASAAIKRTKVRWESINFENPQIIEGCEKALREIAAEQK